MNIEAIGKGTAKVLLGTYLVATVYDQMTRAIIGSDTIGKLVIGTGFAAGALYLVRGISQITKGA